MSHKLCNLRNVQLILCPSVISYNWVNDKYAWIEYFKLNIQQRYLTFNILFKLEHTLGYRTVNWSSHNVPNFGITSIFYTEHRATRATGRTDGTEDRCRSVFLHDCERRRVCFLSVCMCVYFYNILVAFLCECFQ